MQRNDPGYDDFRAKVLKRDRYHCQMPGCKSYRKQLEVHHVLTYSRCRALRTETSNGITLCKKCHKEISGKEHHYQNLFTEIIFKNETRLKK